MEEYKIGTPFIDNGVKWYPVHKLNHETVKENEAKKIEWEEYKSKPREPFSPLRGIPMLLPEYDTVEYFQTIQGCEAYIANQLDQGK